MKTSLLFTFLFTSLSVFAGEPSSSLIALPPLCNSVGRTFNYTIKNGSRTQQVPITILANTYPHAEIKKYSPTEKIAIRVGKIDYRVQPTILNVNRPQFVHRLTKVTEDAVRRQSVAKSPDSARCGGNQPLYTDAVFECHSSVFTDEITERPLNVTQYIGEAKLRSSYRSKECGKSVDRCPFGRQLDISPRSDGAASTESVRIDWAMSNIEIQPYAGMTANSSAKIQINPTRANQILNEIQRAAVTPAMKSACEAKVKSEGWRTTTRGRFVDDKRPLKQIGRPSAN